MRNIKPPNKLEPINSEVKFHTDGSIISNLQAHHQVFPVIAWLNVQPNYPIYQHPIFQGSPAVIPAILKASDKRIRAATIIQALYRGRSVRQIYKSIHMNPIVRRNNPTNYLLHHLIEEAIQDCLLDIIVDECEKQYCSVSKTLRFQYHQQYLDMISGICFDIAKDCIGQLKQTDGHWDPNWEYIIDNVIHTELTKIIHEISDQYAVELMNSRITEGVYVDLIIEMIREDHSVKSFLIIGREYNI